MEICFNLPEPVNRRRTKEAVSNWSVDEVVAWLEAMQFPEHKHHFTVNDVHGKRFLTLNRRDLTELGVTKIGHAKRIVEKIEILNAAFRR